MKKYLKPAIALANYEEEIMAAMSIHEEIGDGQLGKETPFEEDAPATSSSSIWDE